MLHLERLEDRLTPAAIDNILNFGGIETVFLRDGNVNVVITDGQSHVLETFSMTDGRMTVQRTLGANDPMLDVPGFYALRPLGDAIWSNVPYLLDDSISVVQFNLGDLAFSDNPNAVAEVFINDGSTSEPWSHVLEIIWPLGDQQVSGVPAQPAIDAFMDSDLDSVFAMALDEMRYVIFRHVQDMGYQATMDDGVITASVDDVPLSITYNDFDSVLSVNDKTISLLDATGFAELDAELFAVFSQ